MNQLKKILMSFTKKYYRIKQFIYNQGDLADYVYIIESGDFEVTRTSKVSKQSRESSLTMQSHQIKSLIGPLGNKNSIKNTKGNGINQNIKNKQQLIKVALIGKGQIFGQEDVLSNRNYTTSVQCVSMNAAVYCMKAEEFNYRMAKDERVWKSL